MGRDAHKITKHLPLIHLIRWMFTGGRGNHFRKVDSTCSMHFNLADGASIVHLEEAVPTQEEASLHWKETAQERLMRIYHIFIRVVWKLQSAI